MKDFAIRPFEFFPPSIDVFLIEKSGPNIFQKSRVVEYDYEAFRNSFPHDAESGSYKFSDVCRYVEKSVSVLAKLNPELWIDIESAMHRIGGKESAAVSAVYKNGKLIMTYEYGLYGLDRWYTCPVCGEQNKVEDAITEESSTGLLCPRCEREIEIEGIEIENEFLSWDEILERAE